MRQRRGEWRYAAVYWRQRVVMDCHAVGQANRSQ